MVTVWFLPLLFRTWHKAFWKQLPVNSYSYRAERNTWINWGAGRHKSFHESQWQNQEYKRGFFPLHDAFSVFTNTLIVFFLFFSFFLFRTTPAAIGSSQARGQMWAAAVGLHHRHWARSGIELASVWILIRVLTLWATMRHL